jgi:hypothetical protein
MWLSYSNLDVFIRQLILPGAISVHINILITNVLVINY